LVGGAWAPCSGARLGRRLKKVRPKGGGGGGWAHTTLHPPTLSFVIKALICESARERPVDANFCGGGIGG